MITFSYDTPLLNAVERSVHSHGPSRLSVVELFFSNDRCYAYNYVYNDVFRINLFVTDPPQRTRLLSDVNVSGGLFLC